VGFDHRAAGTLGPDVDRAILDGRQDHRVVEAREVVPVAVDGAPVRRRFVGQTEVLDPDSAADLIAEGVGPLAQRPDRVRSEEPAEGRLRVRGQFCVEDVGSGEPSVRGRAAFDGRVAVGVRVVSCVRVAVDVRVVSCVRVVGSGGTRVFRHGSIWGSWADRPDSQLTG